MGEWGGLRLKGRLRCGLGSRLLEWHPRTSAREVRKKLDASKMQDESGFHVPSVPPISPGAHLD